MKIHNSFSGYIKSIFAFGFFLSLLPLNNLTAQHNMTTKLENDSTLMMRQHMIHLRSPMVMPFDMNKVTHYFIDTDEGGILRIKVKNTDDNVQINLIRDHLKKEQSLFSRAKFTDPQTLHGTDMPGLKVLSKSESKFKVTYRELSDGAQLTFTSEDKTVIEELHQWFAAQLNDHGQDAKNNRD